MLDCTHDHASHIHPHPQQKAEPGWGPHLPGVAGRHDLVPREVLLPLPSAWALLWQETGIPVSEQAKRTQQAGGQESTLPISVTCGGPCIHTDAPEWLSAFTLEESGHVPTSILLLPSGVQRYLGNWKNQRRTWPSSEVSAIHQEARLISTSHMLPPTRARLDASCPIGTRCILMNRPWTWALTLPTQVAHRVTSRLHWKEMLRGIFQEDGNSDSHGMKSSKSRKYVGKYFFNYF